MFFYVLRIAFACFINLLILSFVAMSFFYGLQFILVRSNTDPTNNSSAISINDTIVLPGHHFKDSYMTSIIALIICTWLALALLYRLIFHLKLPAPSTMHRHERKAWSRKWDAAALALPTIFIFVIYLTFEVVIRICIELRLHVPLGFAAIEIPSRIFLVIGDLMLLLLVVSVNESMVMRLEVDYGFRHALYIWVVGMSCTASVLLGLAQQVYAIVCSADRSFAWDQSDWVQSALVRTLYCLINLGLALFSSATAFVVVIIRKRHNKQASYVDLCGNIPAYSALLIAPALVAHWASAFYFTYFFQYKQKPEPPHLELFRMALVCLPVVIVMVGALQARREDVRMDSGFMVQYQDDQTEHMLDRTSVKFETLPAYDALGQKIATWSQDYEDIRPALGHEELHHDRST